MQHIHLIHALPGWGQAGPTLERDWNPFERNGEENGKHQASH